MYTLDIIKYGHKDVMEAVKGLSPEDANVVGVTSKWSVKDTLAHLASFEHFLEDTLNFVVQPEKPRPYLDSMMKAKETFNDDYVEKYKSMNLDEVTSDYVGTYERVSQIISLLSPERLCEAGTIPWYGDEYSLDDFIVYASYGHKREHVGQIKQFRIRLNKRNDTM